MKNSLIQFTKMHGLGNDFVVINTLNQNFNINKLSIHDLANRHIGIGFDQLLLIEPSTKADFFCRIFNSDGSEAEQCGNGLRCVARFIHEHELKTDTKLKIETKAGIFPLTIENYNHICIAMGSPQIKNNLMNLNLSQTDNSISISVISVGNPHAITKVNSFNDISIDKLAQEISSNFVEGVNVGFMQVINHQHIKLRTIERGVGETFACGSNACAAAVVGIANGWLQNHVVVEFNHGSLQIDWEGENHPVYMTGPASKVFEGSLIV